MHISVWQQFSSNHSAEYTVVGVFESTDKAYTVAEEIRELLVEILEWNSRERKPDIGWQPNPVEERIAREHGFDWKEPVDWLRPFQRYFAYPYQRAPEEHVIQWDRVVMIEAPGGSSTWQTGHQFANLLKAQGAKTYNDIFMGESPDSRENVFFDFEFDVVIDAPTTAIADEIQHQIELHLALRDWETYALHSIPWITYHPRYARLTGNMSREELEAIERTWLRESHAWRAYIKGHQNAPDLSEQRPRFIKQDERNHSITDYLRRHTTLSTNTTWKRDDHRIALHSTSIGTSIADALPSFGAWLQAQGCTVSYEFREIS